jgi:hypothetical protein
MLMVYSRVTTSAMAERVFLPVVWTVLDISGTGRKEMSVIFSPGGKELRDTKNMELILTEWADRERRLSLAMWSTVEGIGIFGCRFFGGRNSVWLAYRLTTL